MKTIQIEEIGQTLSVSQFLESETYKSIQDNFEYEIDCYDDLVHEVETFESYSESENGAETVWKVEIDGIWLFGENINNEITIQNNGSWHEYFSGWDDDVDTCLERFCMGDLIEYEEVEEDYVGEVSVYRHENEINPIYNSDGWERDDDGIVKKYSSYDEAYEEYYSEHDNFVQNGHYDPINYTICKA